MRTGLFYDFINVHLTPTTFPRILYSPVNWWLEGLFTESEALDNDKISTIGEVN